MDGGRTHKKRGPGTGPGPASLIAVITLRHLLREEKQGMTSSRISFKNYFSSKNKLSPPEFCGASHVARFPYRRTL
jgi:hypothetical protein